MEGFGLRGIPDMIGRLVVDNYLVGAWAIYALIVVMAAGTFLWGNPRRSVRAARMFWPMLLIGFAMTFVTPTGG